ncbi:Uncharacterised protein [Candidatus Bilamarchaeum dharawalense]|uniref:Nudix hydrolase domain-containing protein n=1 Tax=Candidatus Bilamarchaeum dharawalense TaxID=2885759 RepID=A0A5E4LPL6_9ARCH|nr:Uncharacterised protein [Candidatus Bilamarchaeum dharawalense]
MEKKLISRLHKYFYTIARREGVERMAVGLFLISEDKLLVMQNSIPKAKIGNEETIDQVIEALAKEHGIEDLRVIALIDRVNEIIDGEQVHRLNFAVSGKLQNQEKYVWLSEEELPKQLQKTLENYWKKKNNMVKWQFL